MCGHHTEAPTGFVEEMDRSAQNDEEHPEFVYGSVDYAAPSHIDVDRPQAAQNNIPTTCFVVESSTDAVRSGFFHSALYAIAQILDGSEPKMKRRVSIVTFNEAVYFHELTKSGGFRSVTMCDIDDPFVPLSPEVSFVDIDNEFGRACVRGLLQHLQAITQFEPENSSRSRESCSVAGTALQVCIEAVAQTGGGDVCIFQATSPSAGLGVIQPTAPAESTDIQQAAFYQEILATCVKGGVAVSAVLGPAPNVKIDSKTLQWLPWRTGGDVLHLPNFSGQTGCHTMADHMSHWAKKMQASAYGCVFKLRCSKGLSCVSLVAPFSAASSSTDSSAFELPRLSPDTSFAFTIQPEVDQDGEDDIVRRRDDRKRQLFVQAAILYTNGEGERLLRIHTMLISVVFSVRAVYNSVSVAPLVALMLKQAVMMAMDRKNQKVQPKDHLLQLCLKILCTYRRHCYTSDVCAQNLVVSKSLALLPLYILAARKLLYSINLEKDDAYREDRLLRIMRMPIHSLLVALYPRAHALPVPSIAEENGGGGLVTAIQDSKNVESALATPCPLFEEHLANGPSPAYIVANGFEAWLLRTESGNSLEETAADQIVAMGQKACSCILEKLQPSISPMTLRELPVITGTSESNWQDKVRLATLFVEDEGATEMSYTDWVEFLQGHIMHSCNR
jgi:hypothetical protein